MANWNVSTLAVFCGVLPHDVKFLSLSARVTGTDSREPHRRSLPFWSVYRKWMLVIIGRHPPASRRNAGRADTMDGVTGTHFSVWAPNAFVAFRLSERFNYWDERRHPVNLRKESGIWGCLSPARIMDNCINSELLDANGNLCALKPILYFEGAGRSETASMICGLPEKVTPAKRNDKKPISLMPPISIYEVHLGS